MAKSSAERAARPRHHGAAARHRTEILGHRRGGNSDSVKLSRGEANRNGAIDFERR